MFSSSSITGSTGFTSRSSILTISRNWYPLKCLTYSPGCNSGTLILLCSFPSQKRSLCLVFHILSKLIYQSFQIFWNWLEKLSFCKNNSVIKLLFALIIILSSNFKFIYQNRKERGKKPSRAVYQSSRCFPFTTWNCSCVTPTMDQPKWVRQILQYKSDINLYFTSRYWPWKHIML